jgi:hypothetical protein
MDGLNRRLVELEASTAARPAGGQRMSDADVLRQVRELLGASEARQQHALAKVTQDASMQRQADLAAISQSMTRLQNASDNEVRQYRDAFLRLGRTAYQQSASQK